MAELEKLLCTDSKVESLKKINAIIENGGGGGLEIGDIGIAPLGIDETQGKRRYLNGQLIIQEQYVQFTNKVKSAVALYPSLACTESEWQTAVTMSTFGACGKFVIDDTAGTIRLPKITGFIQGLTDLSKLGEIVEAGLPNIEGTTYGARGDNTFISTGCFKSTTASGTGISISGSSAQTGIELNASRSNPIYGNNDTVQPEAIKYPYFIQVATGAETEDNIVNEIELNNPFSLLDYKYSEYELNNISWLRSEGQYNSKAIYPAVYDLLLKIYNGTETKAGVSVKLSTEAFTDYDFVLNTAEETFRLPVITKQRVLVASKQATADDLTWYNLYSDGWIEQGGRVSVGKDSDVTVTFLKPFADTHYYANWISCNGAISTGAGARATDTLTTTSMRVYNGQDVAMTANWQACGYAEIPTENNNLYFYVGETVQNANLINAGRIEEKLVDKLDRGNKEEIISWGIPDYTAGVLLTLSQLTSGGYIAPTKGVIAGKYNPSGTSSYINVNGSLVSGGDQSVVPLYAQVEKNDIITGDKIASTYFGIYFYPLKGAK